jgi:hypothetical protein
MKRTYCRYASRSLFLASMHVGVEASLANNLFKAWLERIPQAS